jgi:hypothetical protein
MKTAGNYSNTLMLVFTAGWVSQTSAIKPLNLQLNSPNFAATINYAYVSSGK